MQHILVAYDGGAPARRALEAAIDLADRYDASLAVVSVIPVRSGRSPIDPWNDGSVHARQLLEAREILAEHGREAELLEPSGDPAKAIERVVEMGHFDTVVVGSRGLGPISRVFQGSVSQHVAANAQATVIIAR